MPFEISGKLCNFVKNETYQGVNFNTPADIDKAINMIIKGIKTPYTKALKPVLESLIENTYGEVDLVERIWEVNEKIKWLDLIRLINKNK